MKKRCFGFHDWFGHEAHNSDMPNYKGMVAGGLLTTAIIVTSATMVYNGYGSGFLLISTVMPAVTLTLWSGSYRAHFDRTCGRCGKMEFNAQKSMGWANIQEQKEKKRKAELDKKSKTLRANYKKRLRLYLMARE